MLTITNRSAFNTTLVLSIAFHIAVLYYLATSWNIIPPLVPRTIDKTIQTVFLQPPPPKIQAEPEDPRVRPHHVERVIEAPPVPPLNIAPQPPRTNDAPGNTLVINTPIKEQPVAQPLPNYPRRAAENDIQGRVLLSITILPDGRVTEVQVVNATPQGVFERAAIDAVLRWRYAPSNMIRKRVIVDIDFVLRD